MGVFRMRLAHKVALVTGAGSGIGEAIVRLFAKEGAAVAVADCDAEGGARVADEVVRLGGRGFFVETDVSKAEDCARLVAETVQRLGQLDVACNIAGVGLVGTVPSTSEADWNRLLDVNLTGTFLVCKAVLNHMIERKAGNIVNMSSVGGVVGLKARAAYCAAKGGVIALTKCMALDHVTDGVRVNCICPGTVDTPWIRRRLQECTNPEAEMEALRSRQPMGRLGRPEEIAMAALYLASDESAFVTGTALIVDGGMTAG
jgi:NAD(P)-dependent dehydrogenase (short-subunit alcohol dehydrogenase family)